MSLDKEERSEILVLDERVLDGGNRKGTYRSILLNGS